MKPLGFDLTALANPKPVAADFAPDCPGASVRFTRKDLADAIREGEHFRTESKDLPAEGYGQARVRCSNFVEQILGTTTGHKQFYGLCQSCSQYEAANRQMLRKRALIAAQGKKARRDDDE